MQDKVNMAAESEFDEEEEPSSFSDPENFVDDINDEDAMKSAKTSDKLNYYLTAIKTFF